RGGDRGARGRSRGDRGGRPAATGGRGCVGVAAGLLGLGGLGPRQQVRGDAAVGRRGSALVSGRGRVGRSVGRRLGRGLLLGGLGPLEEVFGYLGHALSPRRETWVGRVGTVTGSSLTAVRRCRRPCAPARSGWP